MLKKSSVVVLLVIVMMSLSSIEVKANENVVGEEVTIEPENQFTSYRSPLDDEIVFDESSYNEVDVVNEEVSVEENTNLEINEEGIEEREEEEEKDNYIKEKTVKEEVKYLDMVPQTGDSSNLVLWGVLLVVALGATIGLGIYLIKKK